MNRLTIPLNGKHVDVEFTFDKGYEATFDDPGCPDDCEVHHVYYREIDILPVMHEDDIEAIYNYIYDYIVILAEFIFGYAPDEDD